MSQLGHRLAALVDLGMFRLDTGQALRTTCSCEVCVAATVELDALLESDTRDAARRLIAFAVEYRRVLIALLTLPWLRHTTIVCRLVDAYRQRRRALIDELSPALADTLLVSVLEERRDGRLPT